MFYCLGEHPEEQERNHDDRNSQKIESDYQVKGIVCWVVLWGAFEKETRQQELDQATVHDC